MNEDIKQQEPQGNGVLPCVSGSADLTGTIETTSAVTIGRTTTDTNIWKGGYVTDNFHSYYLDENMVKHYRQRQYIYNHPVYISKKLNTSTIKSKQQ